MICRISHKCELRSIFIRIKPIYIPRGAGWVVTPGSLLSVCLQRWHPRSSQLTVWILHSHIFKIALVKSLITRENKVLIGRHNNISKKIAIGLSIYLRMYFPVTRSLVSQRSVPYVMGTTPRFSFQHRKFLNKALWIRLNFVSCTLERTILISTH